MSDRKHHNATSENSLSTDKVKLRAVDADDLGICSALLQDAVVKIDDLAFLPRVRRFAALVNRFCWERENELQRVRSGIHIENVLRVQTRDLQQDKPGAIHILLGIQFFPGDTAEAGEIEFIFSDGGAIRLEVEYIDIYLDDLSAPWLVDNPPVHDISDEVASEAKMRTARK